MIFSVLFLNHSGVMGKKAKAKAVKLSTLRKTKESLLAERDALLAAKSEVGGGVDLRKLACLSWSK